MKALKAILGVVLPWLRSKKAQTFVVGLLAQFVVARMGLDEAAATELSFKVWTATLGLIGAFMVQDAASKGKTSANYSGDG
jgi:hypothetical protein